MVLYCSCVDKMCSCRKYFPLGLCTIINTEETYQSVHGPFLLKLKVVTRVRIQFFVYMFFFISVFYFERHEWMSNCDLGLVNAIVGKNTTWWLTFKIKTTPYLDKMKIKIIDYEFCHNLLNKTKNIIQTKYVCDASIMLISLMLQFFVYIVSYISLIHRQLTSRYLKRSKLLQQKLLRIVQ